jgi:hypothetical protein
MGDNRITLVGLSILISGCLPPRVGPGQTARLPALFDPARNKLRDRISVPRGSFGECGLIAEDRKGTRRVGEVAYLDRKKIVE